jgi:hypothetical protein
VAELWSPKDNKNNLNNLNRATKSGLLLSGPLGWPDSYLTSRDMQFMMARAFGLQFFLKVARYVVGGAIILRAGSSILSRAYATGDASGAAGVSKHAAWGQ